MYKQNTYDSAEYENCDSISNLKIKKTSDTFNILAQNDSECSEQYDLDHFFHEHAGNHQI